MYVSAINNVHNSEEKINIL